MNFSALTILLLHLYCGLFSKSRTFSLNSNREKEKGKSKKAVHRDTLSYLPFTFLLQFANVAYSVAVEQQAVLFEIGVFARFALDNKVEGVYAFCPD